MRLPAVAVLTILAAAPSTVVQERAKFEVFGGYSLEHISACGAAGDAFLPCARFVSDGYSFPANFNGWNVSVTDFIYKFVGVTANLGALRNDRSNRCRNFFRFNLALQLHVWSRCCTPQERLFRRCARALRGVSGTFGSFSYTFGGGFTGHGYPEFGWAIGGGFDLYTSRHLALRPVQFDYERVAVPGGYPPVGGFRYSAGVVFKFQQVNRLP